MITFEEFKQVFHHNITSLKNIQQKTGLNDTYDQLIQVIGVKEPDLEGNRQDNIALAIMIKYIIIYGNFELPDKVAFEKAYTQVLLDAGQYYLNGRN